MSFPQAHSNQNVQRLYMIVIEDVIDNIRDIFLDEGLDESNLNELSHIWQMKLEGSSALEMPLNIAGHSNSHLSNVTKPVTLPKGPLSHSSLHAAMIEASNRNRYMTQNTKLRWTSNKQEPVDVSARPIPSTFLNSISSSVHNPADGMEAGSATNNPQSRQPIMFEQRFASQQIESAMLNNTLSTIAAQYANNRQQSNDRFMANIMSASRGNVASQSLMGNNDRVSREQMLAAGSSMVQNNSNVKEEPSFRRQNQLDLQHESGRGPVSSSDSATSAQNALMSETLRTQFGLSERCALHAPTGTKALRDVMDSCQYTQLSAADMTSLMAHLSSQQAGAADQKQQNPRLDQLGAMYSHTNIANSDNSSSGASVALGSRRQFQQRHYENTQRSSFAKNDLLTILAAQSDAGSREGSIAVSGQDAEIEGDGVNQPFHLNSSTHFRSAQSALMASGNAAPQQSTALTAGIGRSHHAQQRRRGGDADKRSLSNRSPSIHQIDGSSGLINDDDGQFDEQSDDSIVDEIEDVDEKLCALSNTEFTCPDGTKEDSEPLNTDDDVSEEDPTDLFDTDNVVVCQFDKINRSKARWKFVLKDGIMNIKGKDYVFSRAQGEAEW